MCGSILAGVPLGGTSNESGVVDNGMFGDLSSYFFRNFREKVSDII